MKIDEKELSFLILGSRGGTNRLKMLQLLEDRPYNINQMAKRLGLNYRTIQHHAELLEKHGIIHRSETEAGYGDPFILALSDKERKILDDVISHMEDDKELSSATNSLGFFNRLIKQTNESIMVLDRKWKVFFSNKSSEDLLGHGTGDLSGLEAEFFLGNGILEVLKKKSEDGKSLANFKCQITSADGSRIDVTLSMDPVRNAKGELIGHLLLMRDDSRRSRAERKLKEAVERYRFVFDNTSSMNIIADEEGRILDVNRPVKAVLGHFKKDLRGKKIGDLVSDTASRKKMEKMLEDMRKGKFTGPDEIELLSSDGKKKHISFISGRPLPDGEKMGSNLILTGTDLSTVKLLENSVESAERDREMLENIVKTVAECTPVGIVILKAPDGRIDFMNDRARDLYGLCELGVSVEEHSAAYGLKRPGGEPYPPGELPASRALFRGETVMEEELEIHRPDGSKVHVMANAIPLKDRNGEITGSIGVFWDVTEKMRMSQDLDLHREELEQQIFELRQSQEELERSRNEFSDLFDDSPVALFKLNEYGLIMDLNRLAWHFLGKPKNHLLRRPLTSFIKRDDRGDLRNVLRDVLDTMERRKLKVSLELDEEKKVLITVSLIRRGFEREHYIYLSMTEL